MIDRAMMPILNHIPFKAMSISTKILIYDRGCRLPAREPPAFGECQRRIIKTNYLRLCAVAHLGKQLTCEEWRRVVFACDKGSDADASRRMTTPRRGRRYLALS